MPTICQTPQLGLTSELASKRYGCVEHVMTDVMLRAITFFSQLYILFTFFNLHFYFLNIFSKKNVTGILTLHSIVTVFLLNFIQYSIQYRVFGKHWVKTNGFSIKCCHARENLYWISGPWRGKCQGLSDKLCLLRELDLSDPSLEKFE